jgi:hypothetical protein
MAVKPTTPPDFTSTIEVLDDVDGRIKAIEKQFSVKGKLHILVNREDGVWLGRAVNEDTDKTIAEATGPNFGRVVNSVLKQTARILKEETAEVKPKSRTTAA